MQCICIQLVYTLKLLLLLLYKYYITYIGADTLGDILHGTSSGVLGALGEILEALIVGK